MFTNLMNKLVNTTQLSYIDFLNWTGILSVAGLINRQTLHKHRN